MPKLTKRYIVSTAPMTGSPLIFDEEIKRFAVRVMESGVKSYVISTAPWVGRGATPSARSG